MVFVNSVCNSSSCFCVLSLYSSNACTKQKYEERLGEKKAIQLVPASSIQEEDSAISSGLCAGSSPTSTRRAWGQVYQTAGHTPGTRWDSAFARHTNHADICRAYTNHADNHQVVPSRDYCRWRWAGGVACEFVSQGSVLRSLTTSAYLWVRYVCCLIVSSWAPRGTKSR